MGDSIILFLLSNILIFGFIFLVLTWFGSKFFYYKELVNKKKLYECGFEVLSDLNLQINVKFSIICVFLILYDIEFSFIFPILFNSYIINLNAIIVFLIFILLILFSLFYDWGVSAFEWRN